jgi:hypothetical protein
MPPYGDMLVYGLSTQLHQEVEGFDEVIGLSDSDYAGTGQKFQDCRLNELRNVLIERRPMQDRLSLI